MQKLGSTIDKENSGGVYFGRLRFHRPNSLQQFWA